MNKYTIIDNIEFKLVNESMYNAVLDEDIIKKTVTNIVDSFTVCGINTFSSIMDIPISEEIISRILADAFVYKYKRLVIDADDPITINYSINEIVYKVAIANNNEKLGGIVYGLLS